MLWSDEKSKTSMEIRKRYRALNMQENRLSVNQILMQLRCCHIVSFKDRKCFHRFVRRPAASSRFPTESRICFSTRTRFESRAPHFSHPVQVSLFRPKSTTSKPERSHSSVFFLFSMKTLPINNVLTQC